MGRFRVIRAAWVLLVTLSFLAPGVGRAQSTSKKPAAAKQPDKGKTTSADPTPQDVFARLFVGGTSRVVGVEAIPYGASVDGSEGSRVSSLSTSSGAGQSTKVRRQAVGPRGFTPKEARLVVKSNTLLQRQAVLIAKLQKLESSLSALAVQSTTTPLQRREASLVSQINTNQDLITQNLAVLGSIDPASPAVQAIYKTLSTQAQTIGYQAGQTLSQAGFPTGDRFPATASR